MDLAKYSISMEVAGMAVSGVPEGVGNRRLRFELDLDPANIEVANEIWYGHLEAMFGPEETEKLKTMARNMTQGRR